MSNVTPLRSDNAMGALTEAHKKRLDSLQNGGGGGTFDGMQVRIQHLEDDMKEVKSDLKNIRERLARLEGEVSKLPGYGGIALIVGVIVALSTLVQVASRFIPTAP